MVKVRERSPAARQRFVPVRPGLRPRSPLDIVQIDHTKVDIQLVDDRIAAPFSGGPGSHCCSTYSRDPFLASICRSSPPSAAGVAMAICSKASCQNPIGLCATADLNLTWPMHGLPRSLHLFDNGAEFHSHALKRGCQQHGVRIDYRPPAASLRRAHRTPYGNADGARAHLPRTTSSNVIARGDYPSGGRRSLTLRGVERILRLKFSSHAPSEVHSALATTPAAAWADGVTASGDPDPCRRTTSAVLGHDFLPFQQRIVRREGVRLFNVTYFDGTLAPLLSSNECSCPGQIRSPRYECRVRRAAGWQASAHPMRRPRPAAAVTRFMRNSDTARTLREAGHRSIDRARRSSPGHSRTTACVGRGPSQQQAGAAYSARLPEAGSREVAAPPPGVAGDGGRADAGGHEARVPAVAEGDAWRTEFLS